MSCTADRPCTFREVPLEEIRVEWDGPAVGRKAVSFPRLKLICIDSRFWDELRSVEGRAAIFAHERAHLEGARCESCADVRAGEILRREGVPTPRDGFRALYCTLENRDYEAAAADLVRGFQGYGLDDRVLNRERAAGVDLRLQRFLDWWTQHGPFPVMVGVDGGLRTDAKQLELYAKGRAPNEGHPRTWPVTDPKAVVTYAWSASTSKHGRGEAIDLWPVVDGKPLLETVLKRRLTAGELQLYRQMGEVAESHGFEWGGRWPAPKTDLPHIEIPGPSLSTFAGGAIALILVVAAWVLL